MTLPSPAPLFSFNDLQAGLGYLARLPLANPTATEEQIDQFLDSLLAAPPPHADFVALLEQARISLGFAVEEISRRYQNKPLILGELEEKSFQQVVAAWRKLGNAFALCLRQERSQPADGGSATRRATLLHRCIHCSGMIILEHYRVRRELPPGIWLEVHGHYRTLEAEGLAAIPVADGLEKLNPGPTNCTEAYVGLLLIEMASPYSHSVRNIHFIRRWAGLWAPLVSVHRLDSGNELPSYVIDLTKDAGLQPSDKGHPAGVDGRRLDTSRMGQQIKQTLAQLAQRTPPSQLGLGEETPAYVRSLLEQVVRPWNQLSAARKFRRFSTSGTAKVCVGIEAMHFCITGKEFVQPDSSRAYSRKEFDTLFTFRQTVDPIRPSTRARIDFSVDEWGVINHSANGFRLVRTSAGEKLAHGQLLALCPHDGDRFLLAQATWLMQEQEGGLIAGVAVLPGVPSGVAVRIAGEGGSPEGQFQRAFVMAPVPAISDQGSIVLPTGMYQANRILEIHAEGSWQIRLKNVVQKGPDFDRISFDTV